MLRNSEARGSFSMGAIWRKNCSTEGSRRMGVSQLTTRSMALAKRFGAESAIGIEPWPPRPVAVMRIQNGAFSATPIP